MSITSTPLTPTPPEDTPRSRVVPALRIAAVLLVVASIIVLVWNAVSTSSARVNATTSGSSFFSAGTIELAQPDTAVELLFDTDGLYPGRTAYGCVEIEYRGSIPASVRLHADRLGGSGLESLVELRISDVTIDGCADADPDRGQLVYDGRLEGLWIAHPSYRDAIVLDESMEAGDRFALFATAGVVDDNAAQGLTTEFAITVEARP